MADDIDSLRGKLSGIRAKIGHYLGSVRKLAGDAAEYRSGNQLWNLLSAEDQQNAKRLQQWVVQTFARLAELLADSALIPKSRLSQLGPRAEEVRHAIRFHAYSDADPLGYTDGDPLSLGEVYPIVTRCFNFAEELIDYVVAPNVVTAADTGRKEPVVANEIPMVQPEPAKPDVPPRYQTARGQHILGLMRSKGFENALQLARATKKFGEKAVDESTISRWIRGKNTRNGKARTKPRNQILKTLGIENEAQIPE